jgi:endogenous inhibitor of DNA gyrase (YacG/DUF329 family)
MKCPICHKPVKLTDPEMPFCSERCRLLDLGNWASGKYVISTPAPRENGFEAERPESSPEDHAEDNDE